VLRETVGVHLGADATPEDVAANWDKIGDETGASELKNAGEQTQKFIEQAMKAGG